MPIHALAVVDPAADVHPAAEVGPFCHVRGPVRLAAGVILHGHVSVFGRTTIGAGTQCFPGAVVGGDPQDLKFKGEDSETRIGQRCRIHEGVTINKGTAGGGMVTSIGDDCLLMAYCHIAHDCRLGDRVVIGNATQLAGHIVIGDRAIIGGMTGAHHFVSVGETSIVSAMCGIRYDLPPFVMAEGNPAEPRNINLIGMRRAGYSEAHIDRLREIFRVLYHDKTKPRSLAVVEARALVGQGSDPCHRLVSWLEDYLARSVKGRIQESERPPVVGGAPRRDDNGDGE